MHRLPTVDAYLRSLPGGIDAYPECCTKASVLREALLRPIPPDVDLPAELRALVARPPPVTAWIPEVHHNALMLALYDVHFGGLDAFLAWVLEGNRRLFARPLYRALFFVLSPERLFVGAELRWGTFRKGSTLRVEERGDKRAVLRVVAPARLHMAQSIRGLGMAFQAAAERAGAEDVHVDVPFSSETDATYRIDWR
ncbi:MAG TPA: DUF2378 family protein [Minicystis sp.]|nr:DUF2378 family protein [Minicystis sp.]